MKTGLISIAILLISCSSKKDHLIQHTQEVFLDVGCPDDGVCHIKINPNKAIVLKKSELGSLYYELQDSKDKTVYVYTYDKNVPENIQDATYREEIIFETANDTGTSVISDTELEKTKMLFGRFCYCKGFTGYYKISKGSLRTDVGKKETTFDLNFQVLEVPQVIQKIGFTENK